VPPRPHPAVHPSAVANRLHPNSGLRRYVSSGGPTYGVASGYGTVLGGRSPSSKGTTVKKPRQPRTNKGVNSCPFKACHRCKGRKQGGWFCRFRKQHKDPPYDGPKTAGLWVGPARFDEFLSSVAACDDSQVRFQTMCYDDWLCWYAQGEKPFFDPTTGQPLLLPTKRVPYQAPHYPSMPNLSKRGIGPSILNRNPQPLQTSLGLNHNNITGHSDARGTAANVRGRRKYNQGAGPQNFNGQKDVKQYGTVPNQVKTDPSLDSIDKFAWGSSPLFKAAEAYWEHEKSLESLSPQRNSPNSLPVSSSSKSTTLRNMPPLQLASATSADSNLGKDQSGPTHVTQTAMGVLKKESDAASTSHHPSTVRANQRTVIKQEEPSNFIKNKSSNLSAEMMPNIKKEEPETTKPAESTPESSLVVPQVKTEPSSESLPSSASSAPSQEQNTHEHVKEPYQDTSLGDNNDFLIDTKRKNSIQLDEEPLKEEFPNSVHMQPLEDSFRKDSIETELLKSLENMRKSSTDSECLKYLDFEMGRKDSKDLTIDISCANEHQIGINNFVIKEEEQQMSQSKDVNTKTILNPLDILSEAGSVKSPLLTKDSAVHSHQNTQDCRDADKDSNFNDLNIPEPTEIGPKPSPVPAKAAAFGASCMSPQTRKEAQNIFQDAVKLISFKKEMKEPNEVTRRSDKGDTFSIYVWQKKSKVEMDLLRTFVKTTLDSPILSSSQLWQLLQLYGPSMRYVCYSIRSLVHYYARFPQRVNFKQTWAGNICKGEKFQSSLSVWVGKMEVNPLDHVNFISDVCEYVFTCFSEIRVKRPSKKRKQHQIV